MEKRALNQIKPFSRERGPRGLDLFCGAGAVSVGYADSGWEMIGVDIRPQENYPFEFRCMDAMKVVANKGLIEWLDVDFIHASPPCQSYSVRTMHLAYPQPKLIEPLRVNLVELVNEGLIKGYVIENVEGAPLLKDRTFMLCGTMFGKRIRRHRYFEVEGVGLSGPGWGCDHSKDGLDIFGNGYREGIMREWYEEMLDGRKWMTQKEATQAVPCCYTEYIGLNLRAKLEF